MTPAERVAIHEAGRITGLKRRTLQAMAAAGRVPGAAKLGGIWSFDVERLRGWLRDQEQKVATSTCEVPRFTVASLSTDANIASRYKQLIGAKQNAA